MARTAVRSFCHCVINQHTASMRETASRRRRTTHARPRTAAGTAATARGAGAAAGHAGHAGHCGHAGASGVGGAGATIAPLVVQTGQAGGLAHTQGAGSGHGAAAGATAYVERASREGELAGEAVDELPQSRAGPVEMRK